MPARKPAGLITRAETKADKERRARGEEALRPRRDLPVDAPARLKGHEVASSTWRRVIRMYSELEAEVVTRMDLDLLVDYCLLVEQAGELDTMRKAAYQLWLGLSDARANLAAEGKADEAILMAISVVGAFDAVLKLDGRVDRKRDLIFKMRQSLYLTPRARAGAAPAKKEVEIPKDELEMLLDEVQEYVNGDGQK